MKKQNYDYFLILDFEATCKENSKIQNQEIIEFPVLKVDATTFDVIDKFHQYVRPVYNPQLTSFCTELTGITQEMVDESETFPIVFGEFQRWILDCVGLENRFLFITCGDWDLKTMLPDQCQREKIIVPDYFSSWMNIKKTYARVTGSFVKELKPMLQDLKIQHVGRHHSGIDDCRNIVNILIALANLGTVFRTTANQHKHTTPHPPKSNRVASPGLAEGGAIASEDGLRELQKSMERTMYPSLSGEWTACSPLYQPYKDGDDDERTDKDDGSSGSKDKDQNVEVENTSQIPNFPAIIIRLRENIASRRFRTRDREELTGLCAAGKYLHLMEEEDRQLIESRLRLFYVALCYGWKVAEKDAKSLTTSSVGIDVNPESIHRSGRHHKKKSDQTKVRTGFRNRTEKKVGDDFVVI